MIKGCGELSKTTNANENEANEVFYVESETDPGYIFDNSQEEVFLLAA